MNFLNEDFVLLLTATFSNFNSSSESLMLYTRALHYLRDPVAVVYHRDTQKITTRTCHADCISACGGEDYTEKFKIYNSRSIPSEHVRI